MFELRLLCPEDRVEVLSDALEALDALSVSVTPERTTAIWCRALHVVASAMRSVSAPNVSITVAGPSPGRSS